jgi:hypothetical protein
MGSLAGEERTCLVTALVQCPAVRGRGANFAVPAPGRTRTLASGAMRVVEADLVFNKPVLAPGT